MYNLRYHLASLVAVFLALAVGLLLGSMVAERGMITEQTSSLVKDLEQRFDEINATNEQLSVALERDRAFATAAVTPLIGGRLAGKNVVVLSGLQTGDSLNAVTDTIVQAGATVVKASIITPTLGLDKAEPAGLAGYFQLRGIEMEKPGEALERQVAESLVQEWRNGQSDLTAVLVSDGLLTMESTTATSSVDALVVVGNGQAGADAFALEAARAMNAGGIGMGADSTNIDGGLAAIYSAQGLSTVDHCTTPQGKISLVWILAGNARGYYGFGNGAEGYFPPLNP